MRAVVGAYSGSRTRGSTTRTGNRRCSYRCQRDSDTPSQDVLVRDDWSEGRSNQFTFPDLTEIPTGRSPLPARPRSFGSQQLLQAGQLGDGAGAHTTCAVAP